MSSAAASVPPVAAPEQSPAGAERLRALAAIPLVAPRARGRRVVARLREPARALDAAYGRLSTAPREHIERWRAAEWLLDNHYIVRRALRSLEEEFPAGFERKLRLLSAGPWKNLPLAYGLAAEIVALADGRVDYDSVVAALAEFQTLRSLTIAEVWALPALLRLALLEQLGAAAAAIPAADAPLDGAIHDETGRVVASAMRSLRTLEATDWKQLFEAVSLTERRLSEDPAGVYRQMNFATRDAYRKAVEELAAGTSTIDEEAVAVEAIRMAHAGDGRRGHVGFYLIDAGRAALERQIGYRPTWRARQRRFFTDYPTAVYLGSIGAFGACFAIAGVTALGVTGAGLGWIGAAIPLLLIAATTVAVSLVNDLLTRLLPPRALPKLDYARGLPPHARTLVAVPTLLADDAEIDGLLASLEFRFLGNRDPQVHFALLTDLADAAAEYLPDDEALVQRAIAGIAALNARYEQNGSGPFHLLHRPRRWNPNEGVWMGWERKRGKLTELNRWLLGADATDFALHVGADDFRIGVRFVVVLDADTDLPRDTVRELAAALAHPLNQAEFAADAETIVAGYTILQPRVEISPLSADTSRFSALYSPAAGLDPYTRAVSDLYQDLFAEGSFIGKGIYDVAAFERSLAGTVPENALLSHDLFEGLQGRAGLVSDTVLLEDYPSQYLSHARRLARWVRGDWQLLPWLGRSVPGADGVRPNRLNAIARWKIADNLRRSLVAPAVLLLLLLAWGALPAPGWWTIAALCVVGMPVLLAIAARPVAVLRRWIKGPTAAIDLPSLRPPLTHWVCELAFLPHTAAVVSAAIARTLLRVYVTRRHLLQWTSAAHTERLLAAGSALRLWIEMAVAPLLALATTAGLVAWRPTALPAAAPLLLLWIGAPALARFLSQPPARREPAVQPDDLRRLRVLARRTWSFFETFVGPGDQWLPPDHFQEDPRGALARRTSPTNIGLLQVATLAAVDFGYSGVLPAVLQLKNTFDTLDRLERYRGHLLNWYGTADLEPLEPRYVSTVDSGNLAACLLAVKQGCIELHDGPVMHERQWRGFLDTLAVYREGIDAGPPRAAAALLPLIEQIERTVEGCRAAPAQWHRAVVRLLGEDSVALDRRLVALLESEPGLFEPAVLSELRHWSGSLRLHLERMQREMDMLLPWLGAWEELPAFLSGPLPPALAEAWQRLASIAAAIPSAAELPAVIGTARQSLSDLRTELVQHAAASDAQEWCQHLDAALAAAAQLGDYLGARLRETAARAEALALGMDFTLLYDRRRRLFCVGYNVSAGRLDDFHYDLLASEARMASLVAIATGQVPQEHWLHLGRPIGAVAGARALLSWSGTMFEYLMPALLLREGETTLIGQSCRAAVREQIAYAHRHRVPWGISECGYAQVDAHQNYQYRAFGVPALGFKRGLDEDLVIAPYASMIALALAPAAVVENLERFRTLGAWGRYGLYEAVDFTPGRAVSADQPAIVRSFMAHHQGMVLASLDNFLNGNALIERLHREPLIKTAELLLYERPAQAAPIDQARHDPARAPRAPARRRAIDAWEVPVDAPFPQAHVLSNGHYSVVVTAAGGGGSRCGPAALTRWSADTTLDRPGFQIYLQDQLDQRFWPVFREPGGDAALRRVVFDAHLVERSGRFDGLTVRERLTVAPDADVEIRHLTISSERRRRFSVTSFAEVVLGDAASDRRHPAFSKLFVESEYDAEAHALIFHRRPRTPGEAPLFLVHTLALPRQGARPGGFDCGRESFIGRGGSIDAPAALARGGPLAGSTGATLDPIMALAATLELPPNRSRELAFITAVADSRAAALELAGRYRALTELEWTFDLARHRAEVELAELGIEGSDLPALTTILSLLLYPHPLLRVAPETSAGNTAGRSALWRHALSGDLPILLVRVGHAAHAPLLPLLLRAQAFWRGRGVAIDLVILNDNTTSYDAPIDDHLHRAIAAAGAESRLHRPGGGVFLLQADQMTDAERTALMSAAHVVLDGTLASLGEQLGGAAPFPADLPQLVLTAEDRPAGTPLARRRDLLFDNGLGGFTPDGREYVIHLAPGAHTPAPWSNVIANPNAGCVVTESGCGYTWAHNSGENRLTPWRNDPVVDEPGEVVYVRDEESGAVWSPTPRPAPGPGAYEIRHGIGYTVFRHHCRDLEQQLSLFVPLHDPVKIVELEIANRSDRQRRLTVTYFVEWVLGTTREAGVPHIVPSFDPESETLMAVNPWNDDFGGAVAFVAAGQRLHGYTADRTEFLGRRGDRARPAALTRIGLASAVRPGADPCAALQVHVDLAPGERRTVHFLLGQGASHDAVRELVRRYREPAAVEAARQAVAARWEQLVGARRVHTPEPALDVMLNHWLPYQTLSARVWGRTGFHQSSGAFGFRDQLQDLAALIPLVPELCRAHLIEAASHQFEEGDVLHWWHPPSGAGIRSRCSDDLLWLPFVTAQYIEATGDSAVLTAPAPFLSGDPLAAYEAERYARFATGPHVNTLYDHCLRAVEKAGALGPHGLPLFGSGDWNDGMNRVGAGGRGESVWLGWFLYATLLAFAPLCDRADDREHGDDLRARAADLRTALDRDAWDGQWYRRGYYDDGSPLGSASRDECRIDSIAQSWAVLSGAGEPERARTAMRSLRQHLVRAPERLLPLLAPPFDRSAQEPGYVKGYPPGVRENGGQYTHAAVWAVWALASIGEVDLAVRLFGDLMPIAHALTPEAVRRYRVEPYVVAADIYCGPQHAGRGGWTWYTGSAGWAYRFGWEVLLGLRPAGREGWRIEPSIPATWPGFEIDLTDGETVYHIEVRNPDGLSGGTASLELDGRPLPSALLPRLSDGAQHQVIATLRPPGRADAARSDSAAAAVLTNGL